MYCLSVMIGMCAAELGDWMTSMPPSIGSRPVAAPSRHLTGDRRLPGRLHVERPRAFLGLKRADDELLVDRRGLLQHVTDVIG